MGDTLWCEVGGGRRGEDIGYTGKFGAPETSTISEIDLTGRGSRRVPTEET